MKQLEKMAVLKKSWKNWVVGQNQSVVAMAPLPF